MAMNSFKKFAFGLAAGAMVATSSVGLAQYQDRNRHDRHDRHDNDNTGAIIAGVAILGGVAAIAAASDRDSRQYGRGNRWRYRDDYRNAVNGCANEAERYGRGGVQVTYVDRRGNNKYRVKGMIKRGFGTSYTRWGGDRNRWGRDRSRDRYFSCTARSNGRVTDFDLNGRDIW
jgi:hypothetical protein